MHAAIGGGTVHVQDEQKNDQPWPPQGGRTRQREKGTPGSGQEQPTEGGEAPRALLRQGHKLAKGRWPGEAGTPDPVVGQPDPLGEEPKGRRWRQ